MNIIRGSNIYGYAGIKECTYYNDMPIIRPLITVDKKELYKYAEENNITYFEDSSNQSDEYLRNRIRHHVIPLLQQENPSLSTSISNYSNQLHEAFAYIRDNSVKYLERYGYKIDVNSFINLALIQKKDIINYICDSNGILSNDNKICDILNIIENPRPNLTYDLNGNYQFVKAYDTCYIKQITEKEEINFQINVGEEINISSYGSFCLSEENKEYDIFLKIALDEPLPLTIRKRCDGDKLIIGNGHKKLKDFLIDKKVPKEQRDDLLIITNALNEIIWVIGYYKKRCDKEKSLILSFKEKIYGRKI
jgi:tRNA(Ile)-lysidine synthetase-like protein